MRVLVVGSGGREHALIWKLRNEQPDAQIYAAPGNGGTKALAESVPLRPTEVDALADFAASRDIDLTVVGPEAPLAAGIVDVFENRGLRCFGPTRAAAEIESSKSFAKQLMAEAGIPTAPHATFYNFTAAERYLRAHGAPIVVKASGLAAGKGAIVCHEVEAAVEAARSMMQDERFGTAGSTVVVEEFLQGEELSVLALTDGTTALALAPAQDHKPIGEDDTGPNTGGMGAYSPVSIADDALVGRVMDEIVLPTLAALRERERPYRGVLYCGLMLCDGDPYVIEFNCRFGDPETQAVLPVTQTPLLPIFERIARREGIGDVEIESEAQAAVCTVLASGGYPDSYEKGFPIAVPASVENDPGLLLFHAGTRRDADGRLVTDGGRVMGVVGLAESVAAAGARSRAAAEAIDFERKYFRRDIGYRETARSESD